MCGVGDLEVEKMQFCLKGKSRALGELMRMRRLNVVFGWYVVKGEADIRIS